MRGAIAQMRAARAFELGLVLARLHQRDRILADFRRAARLLQQAREFHRHGGGVEENASVLLAEALEIGFEPRRLGDIGECFEIGARFGVELCRDRHKAAACPPSGSAQKPAAAACSATSSPRILKAQATACGSLTRSASALPSAVAMRASFFVADSPASRGGCRVTAPCGGAGRSVQIASIGLCVDGDKCRRPRRGLLEALDLARRMQPRIVAELHARRCRLASSHFSGLVAASGTGSTTARSTWSLDLQRVAAIDEEHGAILQDDGKPGRAGEAGQPGKPLFRRRHIFVLMAVGARDR